MTRRGEHGRSLVGLLIALVLLGGLATIALVSEASGAKNQGQSSASSTIDDSPGNAAADIQGAAAVTCRTDYGAVVGAVSYYAAVNGKPPTDLALLAPMLTEPITSTGFVISINPAKPGQVEVAAGGRPAAAGDGNCAYAG
jgi:hypothetical protein